MTSFTGKIVKAKRHAIFSPLDGQPCADHDRASGEGVNPQEYVLIKMELLAPFPAALKHLEGKSSVYLAAATLRPETMYGQTNAWVLPDGEYGAYEISNGDCLVVTLRAARNLSYQDYTAVPGEIKEVSGSFSNYKLPHFNSLLNSGGNMVNVIEIHKYAQEIYFKYHRDGFMKISLRNSRERSLLAVL